MRNAVICKVHEMLVGWLNQGWRDGVRRETWCGRWRNLPEFWLANLRGSDCLEDQGADRHVTLKDGTRGIRVKICGMD